MTGPTSHQPSGISQSRCQPALANSDNQGDGIAQEHLDVPEIHEHQQGREEAQSIQPPVFLLTHATRSPPDGKLQQYGQQGMDQGAGPADIEQLHEEFRHPVGKASRQREALAEIPPCKKEQLVLFLIIERLRIQPHPEREYGRAQQGSQCDSVTSVHPGLFLRKRTATGSGCPLREW